MWVKAIDSSYDLLTESEARRMKDDGVELYIQALTALPPIGLEQPQNRVVSLRNATYAGLKIAGYALLHRNGQADMQFARQGVPDDLWNALEFCAVDVESPASDASQTAIACAYIRDRLPGKPVVVYTSYNQWVNVMGNPPRPLGSRLWDASWNTTPGILRRPYGGWTQDDLLLHQYEGDTTLYGQSVDLNVYDMPVATPGPAVLPGGVDPVGDIGFLHIDKEGGVYIVQEDRDRLTRIEQKLDEVLRRLR